MGRKLRVYGWKSFRLECTTDQHHQTREIVAAESRAAVARLVGRTRPSYLFNLCETGNADEIATAMARPGVVFWRGISDRDGTWTATGGASEQEG